MKKTLMAIVAILAISPFTSHAGDRLSAFEDRTVAQVNTTFASVDDFNSTPCLRYQRKHEKPMSFLLEVSPWGVLSSPDIDGFSTTGTINSQTVTETVDGSGSWMPTIHAGFGVNTAVMDFDFLFGVGFMGNDAFGSGFSEMIFSPRFRLGPYVRFGPFVSIMAVGDAVWYEESDIELEGGAGGRAGVSLAIGGRKVFFNLAISHLDFSYDVDVSKSTWTASSSELDMSGTAVQAGIYCRF